MEGRQVCAFTLVVVAAFFAGSVAFRPNDSLEWYKWYIEFRKPVVVVGIATLIVIGWQAFETRRATEVSQKSLRGMVNKERARISIERKYGDGLFEGYAEGFAETGISITQHGTTNAYNVRGEFKIAINESADPPQMEEMWLMEIPTTIKPTSEPIIASTIIPTEVTEEFIDNVNDLRAFMHFFGFISYQDVFGTDRRTTFRYMWTREESEVVATGQIELDSGWKIHGPLEDNQAT